MIALVDDALDDDPAAAADRAFARGAEQVIVNATSDRTFNPGTLTRLRASGRVQLRVSVATFDGEQARRCRLAPPALLVRGLARAGKLGLPAEVVLPIADGLGAAAGRLHGLVHAAPGIVRYLLDPVPNGLRPLEPEMIAAERAAAVSEARQLGVALCTDDGSFVDSELHALLAGLKPVIRVSLRDDNDEDDVRGRYHGHGLLTCTGTAAFTSHDGRVGPPVRLVYAARTRALAEQARDLEAPTFIGQRAPTRFRELGLMLGYPKCCVESYVAYITAHEQGLAKEPRSAEAFLAATTAFHSSPAWELNHLLMDCGSALTTFTPCSYRCPAALAYATRLHAAIDSAHPVAALGLRPRLSVALAVDAVGAHALLDYSGDVIVAARPRRTISGDYVDRRDLDLVQRLLHGGRPDASVPPPVILRFDRPA